jgi:hypothetical protein
MSAEENIKAKALKCIDEVYPSADTLNDTYFPVDDFLDEAVRWVIDVVPPHILTKREQATPDGGDIEDGVVTWVNTTIGDARIVYFKMDDWARPADMIYEDSPIYRQQKNKVLRGTPSRPIAVRMLDGKTIEAYTSDSDTPQDSTVYIVSYDANNIPEKAEAMCAWKLAEIVLLSMGDMQNASACTARVNELLEQIVL